MVLSSHKASLTLVALELGEAWKEQLPLGSTELSDSVSPQTLFQFFIVFNSCLLSKKTSSTK